MIIKPLVFMLLAIFTSSSYAVDDKKREARLKAVNLFQPMKITDSVLYNECHSIKPNVRVNFFVRDQDFDTRFKSNVLPISEDAYAFYLSSSISMPKIRVGTLRRDNQTCSFLNDIEFNFVYYNKIYLGSNLEGFNCLLNKVYQHEKLHHQYNMIAYSNSGDALDLAINNFLEKTTPVANSSDEFSQYILNLAYFVDDKLRTNVAKLAEPYHKNLDNDGHMVASLTGCPMPELHAFNKINARTPTTEREKNRNIEQTNIESDKIVKYEQQIFEKQNYLPNSSHFLLNSNYQNSTLKSGHPLKKVSPLEAHIVNSRIPSNKIQIPDLKPTPLNLPPSRNSPSLPKSNEQPKRAPTTPSYAPISAFK